jgi:hypothetical protein
MRKPISISELLGTPAKKLSALQAGAEKAQRIFAATQQALGPELGRHVTAASIGGRTSSVLTVIVDSGTYATHIRYALPEALPRIVAELGVSGIERTQVRVRPA